MRNLKKKMILMNCLQGRNRDVENKLVGTEGEGGGLQTERVALTYTHDHL